MERVCEGKNERKSVRGKSAKGKSDGGEKWECFHELHLIEARQDHWLAKDPLASEKIHISRIWILPASA